MSDLETQSGGDDLRSTLESAFAEAATPEPTETVEATEVAETPA